MARPTKVESLIRKINEQNDIKLQEAINFLGTLNIEMPHLIEELLIYAKGDAQSKLKPTQFQAIKYLIDYHDSLSQRLDKAADDLRQNLPTFGDISDTPIPEEPPIPEFPSVSIQ